MNEVAVVILGDVPQDILSDVSDSMQKNLGLPCRRPESREFPFFAHVAARDQYDAVAILRSLERNPDWSAHQIGLVDCDLFIPMLRYVFGLARLDGKTALVSLARLRQEFYGLPGDTGLLRSRVRKEVVHELGHCSGLVHCVDSGCVMSVSTTLQHLDLKGESLCRSCRIMFRERTGHRIDARSTR